ncbi:hypothetical protein [Microbacterium candidum]|uniref:Uncharacterized protein n=1 Tax=Microbacterium candidum TaxID=3041922 RepID=A0ABT7MUZ1_9MICO|nr:hypothetical protein [Microbacterium sp. ASV49]MDL9978263.1 hypothetical protein [Microbacterium sp. ASV49]
MDDAPGVSIPLDVRVALARPAIQVIADDVGADILHIKGDAVDPRLRAVAMTGTDVDALVRPSHVARLDTALRAHEWTVYSTFTYGSPFGHAQTYHHPMWGYFDLHRLFPGVRREPSVAFDLMWTGRQEVELPGARASTPSLEMQATLLVLNSARNGADDPVGRWVDDPGIDRETVQGCVDALQARTAFAAASGCLESRRGASDYRLWKVITEGGTRSQEWWARVRAAPSLNEAVRIAARAPLVNVEQLEHDFGRRPSRSEIAAAFFARTSRALREAKEGRGK